MHRTDSIFTLVISALFILISDYDGAKYLVAADELPHSSKSCSRVPYTPPIPKTGGDNGFLIQISGNAVRYVPGESYTVSLRGTRTATSTQKFKKFTLVLESSDIDENGKSKNTGTLQLPPDGLTKFSDRCRNAVVQTSHVPKQEIDVLWVAPPSGSGCVKFKATVMELHDSWYMDDGNLTKELCEDGQDSDHHWTVLDECCACEEAKYEVVFQGLWSRHTHPKNFPEDNWLTHFSEIIGASHSPNYTMWNSSGMATDGLRFVAQQGATREIESEMKLQSHNIRTIIKARPLWFPNLNGSTLAVFRVDNTHHLMSLVTMLGPSPDWFVGVSRMELCNSNCTWLDEKQLDLYPWDAGTDNGISYMSRDSPTFPQEKIRRITSNYPNNKDSPFYDPTGKPMKPVARLTVTRLRLYEKPTCKLDTREQCRVTNWAKFGACSVTCGNGFQLSRREYVNPESAAAADCQTDLEKSDKCYVSGRACSDNPENCVLDTWSPWGECSVTCGKGTQIRSRKYVNRVSERKCSALLYDRQPCMNDVVCTDDQREDLACAVTHWTDWSPCMVTCGKGFKIRTRYFKNYYAPSICKRDLEDKTECTADRMSCEFDATELKEICSQPKDVGPCRGTYIRWYYDTIRQTCLQFYYGGCRGNKNNFRDYKECNKVCEVMKGIPLMSTTVSSGNMPVDCVVSRWGPWSPCSATCGGHKTRERTIQVRPQNGGKRCPNKLTDTKQCKKKKGCNN